MKLPSLGHIKCEACNGMGFFRHGNVYDAAFNRCDQCKGVGQAYTHPEPERKKKEPLT